jgi:hypothetical protein
MKEVRYSTSSIGQIAYLLWRGVYPEDLTFQPHVACLYYSDTNFADLIERYWSGTTIPVCELSECIVVADRIMKSGKINEEWFREMDEAVNEVREDYLIPLML